MESKPDAQSVVISMGPGCRMVVVSSIRPFLKSSAVSDLRMEVQVRVVKWSVTTSIFWPSLLMISAWK